MKATLSIVVAACLVLLVACGSRPQSFILGRWEVENAPTKMAAEFKSDGTATISILGHTAQGTYKLNGTDELEWSMNGMSTKAKVKVTATDLELTDNMNHQESIFLLVASCSQEVGGLEAGVSSLESL